MPYRRRYNKRTRSSAASTLQRAWRRKLRRKRGGLNQRQTIANAKAIKKLKKVPEVKRTGIFNCSETTNYYGTVLSETNVDNYAMATDTTQWNALAPGAFLPLQRYQPVSMMPILTTSSTNEVGGRVGNKIKMRNLILKLTARGSDCDLNGGRWNAVPFRQKIRCMVVLDKEPSPVNTTLSITPSVFQSSAVPCQVFDYSSAWNNSLSAGFPSLSSVAQCPQLSDVFWSLYQQNANPPGLASSAAGLAQRDLVDQAYRNTDLLAKKRFKILKVKDLYVSQLPGADAATATSNPVRPTNCISSHTIVIKGNYTFHFDNDKSLAPGNQRIYAFFFSDTPTQRGTTAAPIADYVIPPSIQCNARCNYVDS